MAPAGRPKGRALLYFTRAPRLFHFMYCIARATYLHALPAPAPRAAPVRHSPLPPRRPESCRRPEDPRGLPGKAGGRAHGGCGGLRGLSRAVRRRERERERERGRQRRGGGRCGGGGWDGPGGQGGGGGETQRGGPGAGEPSEEGGGKKKGKHRPKEMSSKRPVRVFREEVGAAEKRSRDPRFSALQGEVNKEGFRKRYSFLYDDVMAEEAAEARRAHRKARDPARKERMKRKVGHIEGEMRKEKDRRRSDKEKRAREEKLRDEVRQGKRPKYVSKSAIRREELVEKYEKLKDQGKLDDFMAKRRRKNAAKDHKFIPHRRVDR